VLFVSISQLDQVQQIQNELCGIELRLDLFPHINIVELERFIQKATSPLLLTVRRASHGGKFQGTESEREELIEQLLTLEPSFFDLEYDMRSQFLVETMRKYSKTKFILSYHNFKETPCDLEKVYNSMQQHPAFTYKIATMIQVTSDALRMLLFSKQHPKVSAICMGERGQFARVLGPVFGNLVNYAKIPAAEEIGVGRLSVEELQRQYHYFVLNQETVIYGLIGNPVEKSIGHLHHNSLFRKEGRNAIYVKMIVTQEELADFMPLAHAVGIRGLSVTMPLKENIVPFIDALEPFAKKIGAINTLLLQDGRTIGTNTDGVGALDAIEARGAVQGRMVVLLGAGGAARSIAFEALSRGARVLVLNRTISKAEEVAAAVGCEAGGLDQLLELYDILINCSPDPMPIDPQKIRKEALVMDLIYVPSETPFLKEAIARGCQIIYGEEMFLNQAAAQRAFWI